jgi:putative oxidoreductase
MNLRESADGRLPAMAKAIAALFIGAGLVQLAGFQPVRRSYARWGYPNWFRIVIGIVEIEAGVLAASNTKQHLAALQLIPIMAGSIYTHLKTPGEGHLTVVPAFILAPLSRMARLRR